MVTGALLLSDAGTGELRAIVDCASITCPADRSGRGALGASCSAQPARKSVGIIGCGVNGASAARCLAAAGYGPGVCADVRTRRGGCARGRARVAGGGSRRGGDPGRGGHGDARHRAGRPRIRPAPRPAHRGPGSRRRGQGGARACGARALPALLRRLGAGLGRRGAVRRRRRRSRRPRRGDADRRRDPRPGGGHGARTEEITLFDSTGLAIQDLAIAIAVYEAWREGRIDASLARL